MPSEVSPPATALRLRACAEEGLLTRAQADTVERLLRGSLPWRSWIERLLLFLGATLLLAGVIFFFAYNWRDLSPTQKFAVIQSAFVLCAVAAWWRGLATLSGQVLLTAACVLVGVFLAVFGQVYQTGADTYELFTGWALLIFPWVLAARFGGLWLLWLALLNAALALSWKPAVAWHGAEEAELAALLGLLNVAALAAREVGLRAGFRWLGAGPLRALPCLAAFAALTCGVIATIFDGVFGSHAHLLPVAAFLLAVVVGFFVYRTVLPSLSSLAIIALAVCLAFDTLAGRLIFEGTRDPVGVFLVMALVVVGSFGAAAWWLRQTARQLRDTSP